MNYTPKSQLTDTIACIGISLKTKSQNFMDFYKENFKDLHSSQIALTCSIFDIEKCSFFLTGQNFTRLVMFSVSQVGKNPYRVGKTKCLLRVDVSEANTRHVLAHCGGGANKQLS